jgi:hypothetical protein
MWLSFNEYVKSPWNSMALKPCSRKSRKNPWISMENHGLFFVRVELQ